MPLVPVEMSMTDEELPKAVVTFLQEAEARADRFLREQGSRPTGFVSSNAETVYRALQAITAGHVATGIQFCEWGSGLGVVASLATMLGFEACGIEIDSALVEASSELVSDFALPVDLVQGSFVPPGAESFAEESYTDNSSEFLWVVTDADDAYQELGRAPDDFDVVFAYPWPGEDELIATLFERYAAEEALLLTYDQFDSIHLRRKVARQG